MCPDPDSRAAEPNRVHKVDFEPIGKRIDVREGETLMDAARRAGIGLASVCGGDGTCGRCRVSILSGQVSSPTEAERQFLSQIELDSGWRLACRSQVASDVKVHVPQASLITEQRLQLEGVRRKMQIDAAVRAYEVQVPSPSLHDLRADLERVIEALETAHGLRGLRAAPPVISSLSPLARRTGWQMAVFVRGREFVGFEAPGRRPVGLAVDLGTTKIAFYLVDLETGEELAATGVMNPQIGYGEDVISRIAYVCRNENGATELARVVREAIDGAAGLLADQAGVSRTQIAEACIVGNTAMHHLLLGLPVHQLAVAPFVAAASSPMDIRAADLDLELAPGAYVHVLPCVGGFVGADHVSMIIGSDLDRRKHGVLGVDIGTNTEIALFRPGLAYPTSASCASGPAFEGAHIRDGMRAATGAIEAVRITAGGVECRTIGDAPAVGLCGSGIIDAVAEMHRHGIIDKHGRMHRGAAGVQQGEYGLEFVLVPSGQSGTGRDIVMTQHDVSEIQLAKAAISAGLESLMQVTGTAPEEIKEVVVAGAFGSYLDLDSALDIGLLPRIPGANYIQVGNAAGVGAKAGLLSLRERERARRLARHTNYIELTLTSGFSRRFARSLLFPSLPPENNAIIGQVSFKKGGVSLSTL